MLENIQRHQPYVSQIFRCVICSRSVAVFIKVDIQHPMHRFNTPMAALENAYYKIFLCNFLGSNLLEFPRHNRGLSNYKLIDFIHIFIDSIKLSPPPVKSNRLNLNDSNLIISQPFNLNSHMEHLGASSFKFCFQFIYDLFGKFKRCLNH